MSRPEQLAGLKVAEFLGNPPERRFRVSALVWGVEIVGHGPDTAGAVEAFGEDLRRRFDLSGLGAELHEDGTVGFTLPSWENYRELFG